MEFPNGTWYLISTAGDKRNIHNPEAECERKEFEK